MAMSLWGALYVGTSGLKTSQNALNTVAHNLANADTKGYTRQQVLQADQRYTTLSKSESAISYQQVGLGTVYSRSKQVRDTFLDQSFRRESGRGMFYKVSTEVMDEVESQLGELNGEAFETNVTDLWTSVQELVKDPASSVTQGLFVQRASELIIRAQGIYDGLASYQDNLNVQIKQQVDKVNDYGKKILELNDTIRAVESGKVEAANDYRDARNQILDELGELVDMSWDEDSYGNVSVRIEGTDFVKDGVCFDIGLKVDEGTGFYTAFWPQNAHYVLDKNGEKEYQVEGALVFDLQKEISSDKQSDIGGLKAMLLARGDHRADYTDVENNYEGVSQSVVMNIQAEFDQLMHHLTTQINGILEDAAGVKEGKLTLADGTVLDHAKYAEADGSYMRDQNGVPLQMFVKNFNDGYQKVTATDENGQTGEYWLYTGEDPEQYETLYTINNIHVNQELMQKPSTLGFRLQDGSEDRVTAERLRDLFSEEQYTLNPNVQKRTSIIGYYSDLVSQVSNSGYVYKSIYENQQSTVEYTESARDQVTAVSQDEELTNMIKLQNAYNASSRYISAVSDMLEHMITSLFG
ncbi:MAG: flagellar hook-associated protein FlgK [Lachnospiraceae bacterium]|nr:flagellar hook-associated protein FlgK [Lachnospiraceae bacterium]